MNIIKINFFIFISILGLTSEIFAQNEAERIIKVGAFNYYPGIFKDSDGQIKGFIVDILENISELEKWKIQYEYGSWSEGLQKIKNREVDVLTSVAYTHERASFMDYTTTQLLTVWGEVYVHDKSIINNILDLTGKKIALMKGDFNGQSFINLKNSFHLQCEIIEYDNFESIFEAVKNNWVDAGVANNTFGSAKQKEYFLKSTGIVFNPFDLFFTVKKGVNSDIIKTLDKYLQLWQKSENSPFHQALHSWSHKEVNVISIIPEWLLYIIIILICIVVFIALFIQLLRSKIKQATMKILESEERYELAMHASNDGIFDWNLQTNEIYYSPGWKSMLGYGENEIKNEFSEWERLTKPEDVKKTWGVLNELLAGKRDRFELEFQMRHKDGKWIHVLSRANVVSDKNGKPIRVIGTHLDLTERKNTEKAIIESQRLGAIGEMSSAIAHDFNNSLQSILGNAEIALLKSESNEPVHKYLQVIKTSADDAATRVQLLQKFAGTKQNPTALQLVDLNKIINDVVAQSRPLWKDNSEKNGITISVQTHFGSLPKINANENELRTVIYNLIKNSIEAMPNGGKIYFKTSFNDGFASLIISDTGIGMDEETAARVFQPFFTTKGFEGGRGLGMSSAYGIVQEHRGSLTVLKTMLGEGTEIEIKLPVAEKKVEETPKPEELRLNKKAKILWVDDDDTLRDVAKEMIECMGHEGSIVSSGEEALKLLAKESFDMVFTDIGMPRMSGWQLINNIRENFGDEIKIAILSGWGGQIDEDKKDSKKIDYILTKPFKLDQLEKLINSALTLGS